MCKIFVTTIMYNNQEDEYKSNTDNPNPQNEDLNNNKRRLFDQNEILLQDLNNLNFELQELKKLTSPNTEPLTVDRHILNISSFPPENVQPGNENLTTAIQDLEELLQKIRTDSRHLEVNKTSVEIKKSINDLTVPLDIKDGSPNVIKVESNDNNDSLRNKINELNARITKLEVENTKLKFQNEQYMDDLERAKKQLVRTEAELKDSVSKNWDLEDQREKFRQIITEIENENIKIKKEIIEEMNEANRAKRILVSTENALQHVSEAFENKRKECMKYIEEISKFKKQLAKYKDRTKTENT